MKTSKIPTHAKEQAELVKPISTSFKMHQLKTKDKPESKLEEKKEDEAIDFPVGFDLEKDVPALSISGASKAKQYFGSP